MFRPVSINTSPSPPAAPAHALPDAVTVRHATAADAARIRVVARLDDRRPPEGPFLVAEVGEEIVAAYAIPSGILVADPFRPTADAVALLRLRVRQLPQGASVVALPTRAAHATRPLPAA